MRWEQFDVYHREATGETDALKNPVYSEVKYATITGRFTPWTAEDVDIDGREVTENDRKLITPTELSLFRTASQVRKDGGTYEIRQAKDLGKFRVLYIREMKTTWPNS